MALFQALYGRQPPTILDYITGSTTLNNLDDSLKRRQEVIKTLQQNLNRSRKQMEYQANKKRRDYTFQIVDLALLRLQPYRQTSVNRRTSHKLSHRFFGPFKILEKIGVVAYRLELPEDSHIHPVVHISLLRPYYGCGTLPAPASKPLKDAESSDQTTLLKKQEDIQEIDLVVLKKGEKKANTSLGEKNLMSQTETNSYVSPFISESDLTHPVPPVPSLLDAPISRPSRPYGPFIQTAIQLSSTHLALPSHALPTTKLLTTATRAPHSTYVSPPKPPTTNSFSPEPVNLNPSSSTTPEPPRGRLNLEDKVLLEP